MERVSVKTWGPGAYCQVTVYGHWRSRACVEAAGKDATHDSQNEMAQQQMRRANGSCFLIDGHYGNEREQKRMVSALVEMCVSNL